MRIAFLILVGLHGLIHLMGFVKAFHLAEVKQLTQSISSSFGILWLLSSVLFIVAGLLFIFKNDYWSILGFIAILLSQTLIFYFWKDARFGTFANLIILLVCIVGFASANFYNKYKKEVFQELKQKSYFENSLITKEDLAPLPTDVRNYLEYVGVVGKSKINNFKVRFEGKIRKDEKSEWMTFSSEQYNVMNNPARLFFMDAVMKNLPVGGYHCYRDGKAYMDIRLLSLIKVQYLDGEEMNKAETVTFFNDMCCMAPATLIDSRIAWEDKGNHIVKATFTNKGITISADLYFNEKGELVNFKSNDRYNADERKKLPWSTPLKNYKEINGYKIAGYAEAIYSYPDKELCYGTFETKELQYNVEK